MRIDCRVSKRQQGSALFSKPRPAQLHRSAWLESIRQSYLCRRAPLTRETPAVPVILLRILSPRFSSVPMQPHDARDNLANCCPQVRYAGFVVFEAINPRHGSGAQESTLHLHVLLCDHFEKYPRIMPRPWAQNREALLRSPIRIRKAALAKSKVTRARKRNGRECLASTRPKPPP